MSQMFFLQVSALRSVPAWLFAFVCLMGFSPAQTIAQEARKESLFLTVPNPITGTAVEQIKSTVDRIRQQQDMKLDKIVFDFNPEDKEALTNTYGTCYELASYIRSLTLNGVSTIAFVHARTTGHTVLPVLACGELVMSSKGEIGQVVEANAGLIPRDQIDYYLSVGRKEHAGLILKMIDKNTEVVSGLLKQSVVYFDGRRKNDPQYADVFNVQPVADMSPGQVELYNQTRARRYDLASQSKETRQEVAEWYGVNLRGDFLQGRTPKASRIEIAGPIDDALREKLGRAFKDAIARKENTIFLELQSDGGGSAKAAREIADDLTNLVDNQKLPIRTIAFIPFRAPDLVTIVALGCSEIVMAKGAQADAEAILGDFENFVTNPQKADDVAFLKKNLPDILRAKGLPEVLAEGMLDKDVEIIRARNNKTGSRTLFTRQQMDAQNQNKDWTADGKVKQPGGFLKLNATQAKELRIAAQTVNTRSLSEALGAYGFEAKDIRDAKPHWLDILAATLRRTDVSTLLVLVGIAGLILELKVPGLTIPGIVSALCFLLFFWSQSQLSGQIVYLAALLFLLGLVLVMIEIFLLPGFGVPGIAGILFMLSGLGLATIDRIPQSTEEWVVLGKQMTLYSGCIIGAIFVALSVARYLPHIPGADRMVLLPPTDRLEESTQLPGMEQAQALLGAMGFAQSTLRPAGMARFGDQYIDVVSEGEYIEPGTPIQVIEVEGTRIVVKKV